MPITIAIADPGGWGEGLQAAFDELHRIDAVFSPFRPESQIGRINSGLLELDQADPEVKAVLELCRLYQIRCQGYFSVWLGGRLDPSGLVKGWALERAAQILLSAGARNLLVDGAGDILALGEAEPGRPWRVGVRHPREPARTVRVIAAHNLAVATSGTYERGAHIVEPNTGLAAEHWVSLTVTGPDMVEADVLATAACAMGPTGLDFLNTVPGYDGFGIDRELRAHWTAGFEHRLAPARSGADV